MRLKIERIDADGTIATSIEPHVREYREQADHPLLNAICLWGHLNDSVTFSRADMAGASYRYTIVPDAVKCKVILYRRDGNDCRSFEYPPTITLKTWDSLAYRYFSTGARRHGDTLRFPDHGTVHEYELAEVDGAE